MPENVIPAEGESRVRRAIDPYFRGYDTLKFRLDRCLKSVPFGLGLLAGWYEYYLSMRVDDGFFHIGRIHLR